MDGTAGVREALIEQWFNEYGNAIARTCYICLHDASLAKDAAQDTFVKAFHKMDALRSNEPASVKAWLTRIALNTCKDYRRTAWYKHVDRSVEFETLPLSARDADPQDALLVLDVMRLPQKYKEVIVLRYYHQMTFDEIGGVLRISTSAVAKRIKTAEAKLRDALKEGGT